MRSSIAVLRWLCLVLLLSCIPACGGGGLQSAGSDLPLRRGLWSVIDLRATDFVVERVAAGTTGEIVEFDGPNALALARSNTNGSVNGPLLISLGLETRDNNVLLLNSGGAPYARGHLSKGDTLGVTGTDVEGAIADATLFVRHGAQSTLAEVAGDFHYVYWSFPQDELEADRRRIASVGTLAVAGNGDVAGTGRFLLVDGSDTLSADPVGSMSIADEGRIDLQIGLGSTWDGTYRGAVTADGSTIVVGGGIFPGDAPGTVLLVRRGSDLSAASLEGAYGIAGLHFSDGMVGGAFESWHGTLTFNGVDRVELRATVVVDDLFGTAEHNVGTYTVGANGQVDLQFSDVAFTGAMAPDGQALILGGNTQPNEIVGSQRLLSLPIGFLMGIPLEE